MTNIQQPEALRLAERLDKGGWPSYVPQEAAAELRRLHAESELHMQELRSYRITVENREERIAELESRVQELEDLNTQLCEQQDVLNDAYAELKQKYDLV